MNGDANAEVYRHYADELIHFATGLAGPDDAPDVVVEAVMRAFASARWPQIAGGDRLLVLDSAGWGPRLLLGLEGGRVFLPLYYATGQSAYYYLGGWGGAVVSDQGLDFIGGRGDLYDAELPLLCRASHPQGTLDPSLGLPLLLEWGEAMAAHEPVPGASREVLEWACGTVLAGAGG